MDQTKINIDYCGIQNLLRILEQHGFSKAELKKISARIAAQMGADIILETKNRRHSQWLLCIFSRILREKLWQVFFSLWVAIKSKVW